jgi:membrane protease YdiL (CAAX protease family)
VRSIDVIEPVQEKQKSLQPQEPDNEPAPWTWRQTWLGIALTMLPWMALALALNNLGNSSSSSGSEALPLRVDLISAIITFIFSTLIEGAFLIAPFTIANRVYRAIRSHGQLVLASLGFRSFSVRRAAFWIVGSMVLIFAVNILYSSIITAFHLNLQTNDQVILARSQQAPLTTYATLLVAVFIAPFCEEVFFRGFVLPGLRHRMSAALAIILSALLFAIAHVDPGSFAVLLVIGLLLGFVRWRTASIWPGILLHMLNNGIGAVSILLVMWGAVKP